MGTLEGLCASVRGWGSHLAPWEVRAGLYLRSPEVRVEHFNQPSPHAVSVCLNMVSIRCFSSLEFQIRGLWIVLWTLRSLFLSEQFRSPRAQILRRELFRAHFYDRWTVFQKLSHRFGQGCESLSGSFFLPSSEAVSHMTLPLTFPGRLDFCLWRLRKSLTACHKTTSTPRTRSDPVA